MGSLINDHTSSCSDKHELQFSARDEVKASSGSWKLSVGQGKRHGGVLEWVVEGAR